MEERRLSAVFHGLAYESVDEHGPFAVSDGIRVDGHVSVCSSKPRMLDFEAFVVFSREHGRSVADFDESVGIEKAVVFHEFVEAAFHQRRNVVATDGNLIAVDFEFVGKFRENLLGVREVFQGFRTFSFDGPEGVGFHGNGVTKEFYRKLLKL